jgi:DNA-binding winged helix-turn-helix (wHTH) protein
MSSYDRSPPPTDPLWQKVPGSVWISRIRTPGRGSSSLGSAEITLTPPAEYRLLRILAERAGNVGTDHRLLEDLWGPS